MTRLRLSILSVLALLLCGCTAVVPASVFPFYPVGDKGVEEPGLTGSWTGDTGETLTVTKDTSTVNPGDYIFKFTTPPGFADTGGNDMASGIKDFTFYAHAFELGGQGYIDISAQSPLQGRGDSHGGQFEPGKMPKYEPHMLLRFGMTGSNATFDLMDVQWLADYVRAHPGELHMQPLPSDQPAGDSGPPEQTTIEDGYDNVWKFITAHASDGLWGMTVTMTKQ